jgi:hypothetical protein
LPSWLVSTDFSTCWYQCSLPNFIPISLNMFKCNWTHSLSCVFTYCSFVSMGHADMIRSIVSSNCWHSVHLLSVSVCSILVAWYFICNACSYAATISLSVSTFRSPLYSHSNVSSSLISCLSMLPMHCPCITLFFNFFFKDSPSPTFVCCIPSCFASLFSFDWLSSSVIFAAL